MVCCGDRATVSAGRSAGGCTQHVWGLGRHDPRKDRRLYQGFSPWPGPMLFGSRSPGHSRRRAHTTDVGVPFVAAQGTGQTSEVSSPAARGAGDAVSVTPQCHSSFEWPALPCFTPETDRKIASPLPAPPPTPAAGWFMHAVASVLLLRGVFCPCIGMDRRPIQATGCPRHDLQRTLRTRCDSSLSLAVSV